MKTILTILFLSLLLPVISHAQTHKYYYDRDWNAIDEEVFASYYVVAKAIQENETSAVFRAFDRNGIIVIDGRYSHLDTLSFFNSVFDGEWISYHKNGEPKLTTTYKNGVENGTHLERDEEGKIIISGNKINGIWDGDYEVTKANGDYMLIRYDHGTAVDDKMTIITPSGCSSSYRISNGSIITEHPETKSVKVECFEGLDWYTYDINGLTLSVHISKVRDYGRYYRCDLFLWNHSCEEVFLNNDKSYSYVDLSDGSCREVDIYSLQEYDDIIKRKQNVAMAFAAIGSGLAAGMSSYSTSYTTTNIGGYSYSTVTTTYNPASAMALSMATSAALSSYSRELTDEKERKKFGYLQPITLAPGESINSYFNIKYVRAKQLNITFYLGTEQYTFRINTNNM